MVSKAGNVDSKRLQNRTMGFQPMPLVTRLPSLVVARHGQDGRGTRL